MTHNPFSDKTLKFSVIMPCHGNNWKFFQQSLNAINENDYKEVEVIVIFDGPNKKGERELERLIKEYSELDIRYKVIKWGGAPVARNVGAELATGDIYAFIDPDIYLYPESLRQWANIFEEKPHINRVWGTYDFQTNDGGVEEVGGSVPVKNNGQPHYWAFRFSNYCSGAFPIRKESYVGWRPELKSLQDWDMAIRMLQTTNFEGSDWWYIPHSFFLTEPPRVGGISHDSATHWQERVKTVKALNNIPESPICVVSHGAPSHGITAAKILGADYLPMPSFKPHDYKMVYLLGFYQGAPQATGAHMQVFAEPETGVNYLPNNFVEITKYANIKKVIHWIGSDVLDLRWHCSFEKIKTLKQWIAKEKVINLSEFKPTHDELEEVGIINEIVPLPPLKLYEPLPLPEQFTVAIYENQFNKMYHEALMEDVVRAMPDITFYFFGDESKKGVSGENFEHLGYIKMDDWIEKFSCCLRVTIHDGLPLGPVEFMTAGRHTVTNVPLKGAIAVEASKASVIEGIRKAQSLSFDSKSAEYWKKRLSHDTYRKTIYGYLNEK